MLSELPNQLRSKIAIDANGCWSWNAARTAQGYGEVKWRGQITLAHRLVYELLREPIPDGLTIDHLCRVRHCVNPEHLEPVTMLENWRRGESPTARHARKTHCKRGHLLEGDNLTGRSRPGRECRICRNAAKRLPPHQPKPCVVCGTEFVPIRKTRKYCSVSCRSRADRARRLARQEAA